MATAPQSRSITLTSADGAALKVEKAVAMELIVVKKFFDDNTDACDSEVSIPLHNVTVKTLTLIIEYCRGRSAASASASASDAYYDSFVKDKTNEELKEMIMAAHYLIINDLLELLKITIAKRIQNRSVEYARKFFEIENDFKPEEEEAYRQKNAWAFQNVEPDDD